MRPAESPADVVGRLRPGMRVLLPPGCAEPLTLIDELCRQATRLRPLTLMGGLLLGDYPFCSPVHAESVRWVTFHVMPALRDAVARGQVEFLPIRYLDTLRVFGPGGPWAADAVVVHVAPPGPDGRLSLGVSTSYPLPLARTAPVVLAEVNHRMPRTLGDSTLEPEQVTAWTESDRPLVPYRAPRAGEVEARIAELVAELVPDGATVQVGIGAVPEAVASRLGDHRELRLHSLLVDAMAPLVERGAVLGLTIAEVMGTERAFDLAHENPLVRMAPSSVVHNPMEIARIPRFVSVNSAIEVDLTGQVNAESVGEHQVAGIGGQFDFVEGAYWAPGGRSVIAMPATGRGGEVSRVVARLPAGARVTTPRHLTDCVVTEFGRAELRGRSEDERARALIALAHPRFREDLARAWRDRRHAR